MRNLQGLILFSIVLVLFTASCCTGNPEPEEQYGKIRFHFEHRVDGKPIVFDQMIYKNEAGNEYLVNEIQYFISDVNFIRNGGIFRPDLWENIHYVDTDIESTWTYTLGNEFPLGTYDAISFMFGITEEQNQSLMFVNPPESFMFWPEYLGGGYHYMKLNGKWLDTLDQISPFDFHLGIGQIYHSFPDSISEFVHNQFQVELANSEFGMQAGQTLDLTVVMNVENWFKSPNIYNHDEWGGDIMQTQEAMKTASENGWDVFTIKK